MKYSLLLSMLILMPGFSVSSLADKPKWAGDGGQPTTEEKEQHKDAMTSKHESKDKDKDKDKSKGSDKQKEKD